MSTEDAKHPLAGNQIRVLRKQRGWTLKELAGKAGVPLNTAWRLEQGSGTVLFNAVRIAAAFGLTVYEVWNIPGPHAIPWVGPAAEKSNKLRARRLECGWTLDQLSQRCRISKSTLAQIERGWGPNLGNAVRIAAAFGVSVYDIWSIPKQETPRVASGTSGRGRSSHTGFEEIQGGT